MRFYSTLMFLGVAFAANQLSIKLSDTCQCSKLVNDLECNLNRLCYWNQATCVKKTCSAYAMVNCPVQGVCMPSGTGKCVDASCQYKATADGCYMLSNTCYWTSQIDPTIQKSCVEFSKCSALNGTSVEACTSQNPTCTFVTGSSNCSDIKTINCSDLSATQCTKADDGICFLNNNTCQLAKCSDMTQTQCQSVSANACYWEAASTKCLISQCSNITTAEACIYVLSEYSSKSATVCQWNTETSTCGVVSSASDLQTPQSCYENSAGTYAWNSAKTGSGTCVKCHGSIISVIVALIILLLLN